MKTDGKFIIQSGGITQGIQKELGLTNQECKKLGSIWAKIFDEFDDSNNVKVSNNKNNAPNKNNNYQVYKDAIVEFSQASWKRIVDLVNRTLSKNIQVEDKDDKINSETNEILDTLGVDAEIGFAMKDGIEESKPQAPPRPNDIPKSEIQEAIKYNSPENANKTIQIDNYWYKFDEKGRCERIYNQKPQTSPNGTENSFTLITYDENDEVDTFFRYINEGKLEPDGTKICRVYDKEGILKYSSVDKYDENGDCKNSYIKNEEIDAILDDIYKNLETMTIEEWDEYYSKIQNLNIDKEALLEDDSINNLYFVMQYAEKQGKYFLEEIAKQNKELADHIIEQVLIDETQDIDDWKHYVDDIKNDMAEHPNDYRKLSVDIQRVMHRGWIDKSVDHGDNKVKLNNKIDKKTEQGDTGNCYLLSGIKTIDSNKISRKALNSLRQNLPNGDVLITCKGNGKTYRITKEELLNADYLSSGDDDMRVWELAMDKYRRDMAYEDSGFPIDSECGTFKDVVFTFFGEEDIVHNIKIEELENEYNEGIIFNFSISEDKCNSQSPIYGKNVKNVLIEIPTNHQLRIAKIEKGIVYYTNPWDDSELLHISIEELSKIENLNIEGLDINKLENKLNT